MLPPFRYRNTAVLLLYHSRILSHRHCHVTASLPIRYLSHHRLQGYNTPHAAPQSGAACAVVYPRKYHRPLRERNTRRTKRQSIIPRQLMTAHEHDSRVCICHAPQARQPTDDNDKLPCGIRQIHLRIIEPVMNMGRPRTRK